ncbi:MAG TPA: GNAT family N-acetyltransferase [Deinococcales bacterium]|nr:GNAT family N-acetyltransferase [Deinococcales bacterium]
MTETVRRASLNDLDEIAQICLTWEKAPASKNPVQLGKFLSEALADPDAMWYLAEVDGKPVGFAHVQYIPRPVRLGWRAIVEELHVLPGYGNQLEALLAAGVADAQKRGDIIAIYLLTQPDLEPRRFDMYERLGFKERGREVLVWAGDLSKSSPH